MLFVGGMTALAFHRHASVDTDTIRVLLPVCAAVLHYNFVHSLGGYRWVPRLSSWRGGFVPVASWTAIATLVLLQTSNDYQLTDAEVFADAAWYAAGLLLLLVSRAGIGAIGRHLGRRGVFARTVAVVDASGEGEELARELEQNFHRDVRLLGVFRPSETAAGRPSVDDLVTLCKTFQVDEIVIAAGRTGECSGSSEIGRRLCELSARVWLCPFSADAPKHSGAPELVFGTCMYAIQARPLDEAQRTAKRLFDLVASAALIMLSSPAFLLIACAVRLSSPGPVFFKQKRLGFNNQVIVVWKFRSMRLAKQAEPVVQATRNDLRVTWVGAFLRKSSLDELPQLFNVLMGSMSLVGPRPHALQHNDYYAPLIDQYLGRHRVQPGITGWAQVNGFRGETNTLAKMEHRIEYDLSYIANWSLWLDIRIVLRTPLDGLCHPNAY